MTDGYPAGRLMEEKFLDLRMDEMPVGGGWENDTALCECNVD